MERKLHALAILFGFTNGLLILYATLKHGTGFDSTLVLLLISLINFVLIVYGFSRTKQLLKQHEDGINAIDSQIAENVQNASLDALLKIEKENRTKKRRASKRRR